MSRWTGGAVACAAFWVGAYPAHAQSSPADMPIAALDSALIAAMKSGPHTGFADRKAALAPAITTAFDLPGILQAAVGLRWSGLPPSQQTSLISAFQSFTLASYAANFNDYGGQTIVIVGPDRAVGADQIVQTNVVAPSGHIDRIDYQMRQVDGAWKVVDVLLDGTISNVAVQRSDFRALINTGDASRLIANLNQRAADLAAGRT